MIVWTAVLWWQCWLFWVLESCLLTTSTSSPLLFVQPVVVQKQHRKKTNNNMVLLLHPKEKEFFHGRNVLITGASSGLGRSLAYELASCPVQTLILSARKEDVLKEVALECERRAASASSGDGGVKKLQTMVVCCDLSERESVSQLAQRAVEIGASVEGGIDILINNGGVSSRSRFIDTETSVDEQIMQINFFSGVTLAKALVPPMIQKQQQQQQQQQEPKSSSSCHIVWISSIQGLLGIPYRSSYAASKFAVQGYCESIRGELYSHNIHVHVISPGYIRTNLSRSAMLGNGQLYGQMDDTTASGADPDHVATTILQSVSSSSKGGGGQPELIVAATPSARIALWLKFFCPSLLRFLLVKRYEKTIQQQQQYDEKHKEE